MESTDYGDLLPLVKAVGWAISAAWAIIVAWRGGSRRWRPVAEDLPGGVSRIAGLLVAILLGVLWFYQAREFTGGNWLLPVAVVAIAVTIVAFIVNNLLLTGLIYERVTSASGVPKTDHVVGGLWLTRDARAERRAGHTIQRIFRGMDYNRDEVWPRLAQALSKALFLLCYLLFTVGGSVGLAAAGLLLLSAREPRIEVFAIDPPELPAGASAEMSWRVANAATVQLDPIGPVPAIGSRSVAPTATTVYTLTATNNYATKGVQLGVTVVPPQAKPSPPPPSPPPPAKAAAVAKRTAANVSGLEVVLRARECRLTRNVVIRGAGWLQSEVDDDTLTQADCEVTVARAGRYELFVQYAAGESRPVRVTLDDRIVSEAALAAPTGGWTEPNTVDQTLGVVRLKAGKLVVGFRTERRFPRVYRIRASYIGA